MMSTLPQNVIIHVDYSMQSENVVKCKHYENVWSSATFCSRGTRARMPQGTSLPDSLPVGLPGETGLVMEVIGQSVFKRKLIRVGFQ